MNSILYEIADYKKAWVRARKQEIGEDVLYLACYDYTPLDFTAALRREITAGNTAIIAEVKKASPSKGIIRADFDPVNIACGYQAAGATCISVLTDQKYFQGHDAYLADIRFSVSLPLLRKDFIIDPYQIMEARMLGADCILLIMAILDDTQVQELCATAKELQLSILVEIHNRAELERALLLDTPLLGINNRDLHTFKTDISNTINLLPHIPGNKLIVSESGIVDAENISYLHQHGVYSCLIGETLMRQPDPGIALRELLVGVNQHTASLVIQ
ncbi:MAG: indole-3-glycerol phosphate synthase TrpC [Mariprofundales bacterium]